MITLSLLSIIYFIYLNYKVYNLSKEKQISHRLKESEFNPFLLNYFEFCNYVLTFASTIFIIIKSCIEYLP